MWSTRTGIGRGSCSRTSGPAGSADGPDPIRGDVLTRTFRSAGPKFWICCRELSRVSRGAWQPRIFGGSYGWGAPAGFHHAQSQIHRFLNSIGGYTRSVKTTAMPASEVTLPRILGPAGGHQVFRQGMFVEDNSRDTELLSQRSMRKARAWRTARCSGRSTGSERPQTRCSRYCLPRHALPEDLMSTAGPRIRGSVTSDAALLSLSDRSGVTPIEFRNR